MTDQINNFRGLSINYGDLGKDFDFQRPRPSRINGQDPTQIHEFLHKGETQYYMERLRNEIPWEKDPRWNQDYILPQLAYLYDDKKMADKNQNVSVLEELTKRIEDTFQTNVYSVWANLFPDGGSHIYWHQDQYGYDNLTLSFGVPRRFVMRNKRTKAPVADFFLNDGDLYFFSADADSKNEHSVPAMNNVKGERISLLFFTDYPRSREDFVYDRIKRDWTYTYNQQ